MEELLVFVPASYPARVMLLGWPRDVVLYERDVQSRAEYLALLRAFIAASSEETRAPAMVRIEEQGGRVDRLCPWRKMDLVAILGSFES